MLAAAHIIIALTGLGLTTASIFAPSAAIIKVAGLFVGLTIASGVLLVVLRPVNIRSVCITGLVYVAVASTELIIAGNRLASQKNKSD